ncbi:MAG TPA: hypothetical protein ACQGQJ_07365 [Xylella fastidiosa subsp. multiplex]
MPAAPMFANRVLSFDMACTKAYAELYAELLAMSRVSGLVVETADAFIEAVGLSIINPWEATP